MTALELAVSLLKDARRCADSGSGLPEHACGATISGLIDGALDAARQALEAYEDTIL